MEKGYPADFVLAGNTVEEQNEGKFYISKRVAEAHSEGKVRTSLYPMRTSDYHLLRAGMYAGRAGFSCDGVGGRDGRLLSAQRALREYIAYVVSEQKAVSRPLRLL